MEHLAVSVVVVPYPEPDQPAHHDASWLMRTRIGSENPAGRSLSPQAAVWPIWKG